MQNTAGDRSKKILVLLIILLCIALAAMAVIFFIFVGKGKDEGDAAPAATEAAQKDLIVTKDNVEDVRKEIEKEKPTGIPASYDVMMNSDWEFESGDSVSTNAYVANYKTNSNIVYFDVILKESEETVYSSPYIAVGAELDEIKLDKKLSKGTYPAVCRYYVLDDDKKELCTVSVNISLIIKGD